MKEFSAKNNLNPEDDFRIGFIRCDCESEILVVRYEHNSLEISMYDTSYIKNKRSWYERLRQVWHIILTGEPYSDQIVLGKNQIDQLKGFLINI